MLADFVRDFPKGALLHVHPTGTRSRSTVHAILRYVDPVIDLQKDVLDKMKSRHALHSDEKAAMQAFPKGKRFSQLSSSQVDEYVRWFFLPKTSIGHDFPRFETLFLINDVLTSDPSKKDWVRQRTYADFIARCKRLNVSYVEFTRGWVDFKAPEDEVMRVYNDGVSSFEAWARNWRRTHDVVANWNFAFVRSHSDKTNAKYADTFLKLHAARPSSRVRGIDFLANEQGTPALDRGQSLYIKAQLYQREASQSLRQTMHSGELGHADNPRDAILLGIERLGHGVKLGFDPVTMEYSRSVAGVAVVANVTSNLLLKAYPEVATHPFLRFLRLGIPTSLSTDDEGMFNTDIANEYGRVILGTDINYSELVQLSYNGLESSFASERTRAERKADLSRRFRTFERRWRRLKKT